MQFLTDRSHRPAVRLAGLQPSTPTAPPASRPTPAPELAPEPAAPTAAAVTGPAGGRPATLTDDERVVLEDLFRRASQLSQVCLAVLGVALLGLLVVLMV